MRTRFKSERAARATVSRARVRRNIALLVVVLLSLCAPALADELRLRDGTTMEVDEAWEDAQGVWYKRDGVTYLVERSRVREVLKIARAGDAPKTAAALSKEASDVSVVKPTGEDDTPKAQEVQAVWIYLVGGAKMEVDEANESADGVWFKRGNISTFIERARIDHIERERLAPADVAGAGVGRSVRRERRWTTGSTRLDAIIRQNGARYGVDPYLVFCVMEHESHFNSRAVSPVGARGLMQLMPGTAARFGVRNSHDPAQNVAGGTRYLKELLRRFDGRVELVLAGYNAGEGNVMRFGYRVPPFRETRNYVRRVGARYTGGE
jgi:Zn-finger nucleic acid-binding protein